MAQPTASILKGQFALTTTDPLKSMSAAIMKPPSVDSFYSQLQSSKYTLLQGLEKLRGKSSKDCWVVVDLQSESFDPQAVIKAMNTPCKDTSFQTRLRELSDQGKLTTAQGDLTSFVLPLSFIKRKGAIEFKVGDTCFILECIKERQPEKKEFTSWEKFIKNIMPPLNFCPSPQRPVIVNCVVGANKLFIRGNGLGMSWDKGIELTLFDGKHYFETEESGDFEYKLLLNDKQWEKGDNHKVRKGKVQEISPHF